MMEHRIVTEWVLVQSMDDYPAPDNVVVGLWLSADRTEACTELCYYSKSTDEWFSASPFSMTDKLIEPNYWIGLPEPKQEKDETE